MCVNFYLQILSQSLVTPGTRCPLSAAPPQPVQSMHSLYLPMAYTWPHPLIRRSTFGQPKHEGYFTRWSCYLSWTLSDHGFQISKCDHRICNTNSLLAY